MTNKMALIVAVVLGVLSIIGIRSYVEQLRQKLEFQTERVPFMTYAQDLEAGHVVTEDDLQEVPFIKETLEMALKGTEVKPDQKQAYLGARLASEVKAGQVMLKNHFPDTSSGGVIDDPAAKLKADERLISIPVNDVSGVDGLLRPGDFVDVIITMELVFPNGQTMPVTRTLLAGKPVIATGGNTNRYAVQGRNLYESVTLRLNYKDCNKVIHVMHEGGSFHLTKVKEGTPPQRTTDPVVGDRLYSEISAELRNQRR